MLKSKIIGIIEVDHSTPLEIRERLNVHSTLMTPIVDDLKKEEVFKESLFMCTCNRTLLIYVTNVDPELAKRVAGSLFEKWAGRDMSQSNFKYFQDEAALHFLMRLAVGADSAMFGEDQILGQIRLFYKVALEQKTSGPILNRIIQNLLFAAGKMKSKYQLSRGSVSIPGIVSKIVDENCGKFPNPARVLIIGWGEITYTLFKILKISKRYEISVSNRKLEKINVDCNKIPFTQLNESLGSFDVIITMTSRSGYVVRRAEMDDGIYRVIIDLGVPRNVEPAVSEIEGMKMFDIDDVNRKANQSLQSRTNAFHGMETDSDFLFFQKKMIAFVQGADAPFV